MPQFDTIIRDGLIVDGTRMPRFSGDIGIKDGKIAKIGQLAAGDAKRVIEAVGRRCRARLHRPSHPLRRPAVLGSLLLDFQLAWRHFRRNWQLRLRFCPLHPEDRDRAMLTMTRMEAIPYASMKAGMPWDWVSFPRISRQRRARAQGHQRPSLCAAVPADHLGDGDGGGQERANRPTAETREMCRLLNEAMDAGGCGWSAQRLHPDSGGAVQRDYDGTPMVTDVMHNETALALARVLGERNEGFIQMVLATAIPRPTCAIFEQLAEVSGRPILLNAICTRPTAVPMRHRETMKWLEKCHASGLRIYRQAITTDAGLTFSFIDWNLFDDAQAWCEATTGTVEDASAKLADPARRPALLDKCRAAATTSATIIIERSPPRRSQESGGPDAGERRSSGRQASLDVMLDIAVADDLQHRVFRPALNHRLELHEEIVRNPLRDSGRVGWRRSHQVFHRRPLLHRVPDQLCARASDRCALEEAHWKLSALPAYCAGFVDRGLLREGYAADIVVYDFDKLEILPTEVAHDFPANEWRRVQRADGYRYMLLNGEVTFIDGQPTGIKSGRLLRHGTAGPQPVRHAA